MLRRASRLFVIKSNWEAYMIIYALALGAVERGSVYITQFPGIGGKLLFLACTGAVFMGGAKILDCIKYEKAGRAAALDPAGESCTVASVTERTNTPDPIGRPQQA